MTRPIWMLPRQALTGDVVRQVVADQVEENQRLDFKRDKYGLTDGGKEEVRKDVVGMLNGGGGLLILGIDEEQHRAAKVVPIPDAAEHARWIEQVVNAGVEPYPLGLEAFVVEMGSGEAVVVVRCMPGARTPYARTSKGRCIFSRRKSTEVLEMSLSEIREAFRVSDLALDGRTQSWGEELRRVQGESAAPALVARISPLLSDGEIVDPLDQKLRQFLWRPERAQPDGIMGNLRPVPPPFGHGSHSVELSLDGVTVSPVTLGGEAPTWTVTVSRRGEITLVARRITAAEMVQPPKGAPEEALNPTPICIYPVSLTALAEDIFRHVGMPGPYAVGLALVGARHGKLTTYVHYGRTYPDLRGIQWRASRNEDPLQVPQMQVASLSGDGPHPFFAPLQRLFNAFGLEAPPVAFFRADGTLDPEVLGGQNS